MRVDFAAVQVHYSRMIKRAVTLAAAMSAVLVTSPLMAALPKGAKAPAITTSGALAGKTFTFTLGKALEKGPVVLYFFPKAFTQGCTLEARAFAEAMPEFRAAGAQVVGLSADDMETLKKFSTEECRDAFPVAMADSRTIEAYDVAFERDGKDTGMSDRTSYVIAPDGTITMVHSELDWRNHVRMTLDAVKALKKS
ncbi:peroxiredoxin [Altererythrobacter atlanticus]|uniref:thioredoxin-dependent peroxiredoxin n=1 Tax=Croceibacterium atlanticum TaxID=1267766 RepID=A0A0F7KMA3_9SPHN|nr:peroxiredoxin [Croceibacterium atlanticum]AKH41698.1 Putative peroxiredoxin bcp [Croceibacterium atlanticum]MBB5733162.1 peroxiredoxin [Croceibacterium atlanticum]